MPYTQDVDAEKTARAYGKELTISPKISYEVCNMLRGRKLSNAEDMLEEVVALKRAVPYRRYNQEVAHKRGVGPGRYPQKVAKAVLKLLHEAQANAEAKDLDSENMRIAILAASRGKVATKQIPRAHGRSTEFNEQTTNIELVIEEVEE